MEPPLNLVCLVLVNTATIEYEATIVFWLPSLPLVFCITFVLVDE